MIKVAAVLICKFEPMLAQDLCEAIKEYGIIRADGVIGDREFQGQRDERERDNAGRAQIAFGVHPQKFEQLECPLLASPMRRQAKRRSAAEQSTRTCHFRSAGDFRIFKPRISSGLTSS